MERELHHGHPFLIAESPTLADFFLLPTLSALARTDEGRDLLVSRPRIESWRARMDALPSVKQVRATIAPYLTRPIEHARRWVENHRPSYRSTVSPG